MKCELPSLLDYAEGVAKAGIGLMNVEQILPLGAPFAIGKRLKEPLSGCLAKFGSVVSCHHRGNPFPEQLKNLMPTERIHIVLDDRKL